MSDGSRGPHPTIGKLPDYAVIIRAQSMHGSGKRQAVDELKARGLFGWFPPEQRAAMERGI